MTNTYDDNVGTYVKIAEELRLIRCILERELALHNGASFKDYQFEKFKPKDFIFSLDEFVKKLTDEKKELK